MSNERPGRHLKHLLHGLLVAAALTLGACGDGDGSGGSAPPPQWVTVESVTLSSPTSAFVSGTAWVSEPYVGLHCSGIGCLLDQSTNNDPGVVVSWVNRTTGGSGNATSYYGGGTQWRHQWSAQVPIAHGANTVTFSAFDPGGRGGSVTQVINGTLTVNLSSPASGATQVALNSAIAVGFNSPIDPASVSPSSFSLSGPGGPVAGSYAVSGSTITLAPTTLLNANTSYTARLTIQIRDSNGFALPAEYSWSFTTGQGFGPLLGIWGSSASDVFAVGTGGAILHYDGLRWSAMASGTTRDLYGVWGSSPTNVYAVGALGTILRYDGSGWSSVSSGVTNWLRSVWGNSATDVYTADSSGTVLRYDGSAWSVAASGSERSLYAVWSSSASNVLAVGLLWSSTAPPGGSCPLLCAYQLIERYNGGSWSVMSPYLATPFLSPYPGVNTSGILYGLWGSAASNAYAVGSGGSILHYDGSNWTAMSSSTTSALYAVWGSTANNIYAVGDGGTILRYDGSAWSGVASPTTVRLTGVWGSSATDVYAVGYGALLHFDGSAWQAVAASP